MTYCLSYLMLLETYQPNLEKIHRAGIKTASGVPRQTSTSEIFAETAAPPIVHDTVSGVSLYGYSGLRQAGIS